MRNFLQTANLSKEYIAQTASGVYKAIIQKCKIKSLKEFDVNNIEHLGYFYLSVDTGFYQTDRVGGTNSATKLYKLMSSDIINQFGTNKHQWILLLSFITSVGFQNDETIDYIINGMKRTSQQSELDYVGRVRIFHQIQEWYEENNKEQDRKDINDWFYSGVIDTDHIILYRGFHAHDKKNIRLSNDKTKKKYYQQNEGMGYSYTTQIVTAFVFSSYLYNENRWLNHGLDIAGRWCIGRYVVKRDDCFMALNFRNEYEVIVDPDKVFLIDYKFVTNKDFEFSKTKGFENEIKTVSEKSRILFLEYYKDKNHYLRKLFSNDIKLTKQKRDLLGI